VGEIDHRIAGQFVVGDSSQGLVESADLGRAEADFLHRPLDIGAPDPITFLKNTVQKNLEDDGDGF